MRAVDRARIRMVSCAAEVRELRSIFTEANNVALGARHPVSVNPFMASLELTNDDRSILWDALLNAEERYKSAIRLYLGIARHKKARER